MNKQPVRVMYEQRDGVGEIRFNRPDRLNAIDAATLQELGHALAWATQTEAVRCVILSGEGRAFSAGADVKDWATRLKSDADEDATDTEEEAFGFLNDQIITSLYRLPKPVIAAVHGPAVGMGLDIALSADLRVVSTDARMAVRYVKIGVVPDFGGTFVLPRLVGVTKATELAMTGRFFDGAEADAMGMVTELVEPEDLDAAAHRWARQLADGPPVALGLIKRNLQDSLSSTFELSLRNETMAHHICSSTDDMREGVIAMAEKREPLFVGH